MRLSSAVVTAGVLLALGGCEALRQPASCGQRQPIYVPGVKGRPGTIIFVGGRPCPVQLPRGGPISDAVVPEPPKPPPLVDAEAAIAGGAERLCRPYVTGSLPDAPALKSAAWAAGYYERGQAGMPVLLARLLPPRPQPGVDLSAHISGVGGDVAPLVTVRGGPASEGRKCSVMTSGAKAAADAYAARLVSEGWIALGPVHRFEPEGFIARSLLAPAAAMTVVIEEELAREGQEPETNFTFLPGRFEWTPLRIPAGAPPEVEAPDAPEAKPAD